MANTRTCRALAGCPLTRVSPEIAARVSLPPAARACLISRPSSASLASSSISKLSPSPFNTCRMLMLTSRQQLWKKFQVISSPNRTFKLTRNNGAWLQSVLLCLDNVLVFLCHLFYYSRHHVSAAYSMYACKWESQHEAGWIEMTY